MIDSRPSVLLADDDGLTLELIGAALQVEGFEVSTARTAREALELLGAISFDAIVTDVVFDGEDEGPRILERARQTQPGAVVVLMTGYPAIEAAVSAVRSGALDYLQKPVDPVVLGACIQRALQERQIAGPNLEFQDLVKILSDMVANTIERVDPYTAGHGERTRRYSRLLAERVGLDSRSTQRLELAAIAHDYGKIYLDDLTFLTKRGPLTAAEYREVQKHPDLGARKLGDHAYLREVCQYVAEHHEKWDGTGYPKRAMGTEISLPGRILGVVEVFDSLSTKRSYKEVWELDQTVDFFRKQRGRAFDPEVLDEFLVLLGTYGEEWIRAPQEERARLGASR